VLFVEFDRLRNLDVSGNVRDRTIRRNASDKGSQRSLTAERGKGSPDREIDVLSQFLRKVRSRLVTRRDTSDHRAVLANNLFEVDVSLHPAATGAIEPLPLQ
jgi:hypothetical protein